jgi:hypothetical protein
LVKRRPVILEEEKAKVSINDSQDKSESEEDLIGQTRQRGGSEFVRIRPQMKLKKRDFTEDQRTALDDIIEYRSRKKNQ